MYIEHLRIPVGAGALHAERVGRGGRPILLLHGFGTCAFLWRAVSPRLAEAGFTALALDLLGHGESDRPTDSPYGLTAQAEYVDRALTGLRLPRAIVVGQDIGALVALQLAARRPERVELLVLINPPDIADLPGADVRALQRMTARVALGANSLFGAAPLLTPLLRDSVAVPAHMPDLLVARYLAPHVGSDAVEHLLLLARAIEFEGAELPALSTVRAPTLLVRGDLDRWTDPSVVSRISAAIRDSRVASLPGVGRLVPEEAPGALAALLVDWLAERSGDVRSVSENLDETDWGDSDPSTQSATSAS